jgi:hypothetical protein
MLPLPGSSQPQDFREVFDECCYYEDHQGPVYFGGPFVPGYVLIHRLEALASN